MNPDGGPPKVRVTVGEAGLFAMSVSPSLTVGPAESVTVMVKFPVTADVAVPLIVCVVALNENPAGRLPSVSAKV